MNLDRPDSPRLRTIASLNAVHTDRDVAVTRIKASLIHLAISVAVLVPLVATITLIWYPGSTFTIAGARGPLLLLLLAALVAGPLLTLIVYHRGKSGMIFDLWVIGLLQSSIIAFGGYTLYDERPFYLVFTIDRFSLLAESHVDKSLIAYETLRDKPFGDVIRVFSRKPTVEQEVRQLLDEVIFEGKPDLEARTEYWEPYEAGKDHIRSKIVALDDFEPATERDAQRIEKARQRYQAEYPELGILPIFDRSGSLAMLMDPVTAEPLDVVRINAW